MKMLDKPTKQVGDYLLDIKKNSIIPLKYLSNWKLTNSLNRKCLLFYTSVSTLNIQFNVHHKSLKKGFAGETT